ncbi:hypothetical protein PINS_up007796 [Pythium insidiosum]|nr:hypothetical protein PINS_up007796 [Pythium insidiosum]
MVDKQALQDDDVAFNASAFDVVSSWLRGSSAAADVDDDASASRGESKAPAVQLYRPSSAASAPTLSNGKVLTNEEKEMKKKLLRKSGAYRNQATAEETISGNKEDEEALDREEQELMRLKAGKSTETTATGRSSAASSAVESSVAVSKKRKVSAQDELLEKLREEAARKKAKNLKAKLRLQRKKEEMKQAAKA